MTFRTHALLSVTTCLVALGCNSSPVDKNEPPVIVTDDDAGMVMPIECGPGRVDCDGACVDSSLDAENCGQCGLSCGERTVCSNGACVDVPSDCRGSELPCPTRYFCNETTGFCEVGCNTNDDCAGGAFCELESHACVCPDEGQVVCGDSCVDESPMSCGVDCETCLAPANGPSASALTPRLANLG